MRAVRAHLAALAAAVATALPASPQVVWLDEPWFGDLMQPGLPDRPRPGHRPAVGAMAAVEPMATVGVHCCADVDIASLLAAGPEMLSVPVPPSLANVAGYLVRFLEGGGRVAWGVVPTDGPIADEQRALVAPAQRPVVRARHARAAIRSLLRQRSLVTPHCGLGLHTPVGRRPGGAA